MDIKIRYYTGDDFKWDERKKLAAKFGVELERGEKVDLGRRIEMMPTIDEAVNLKWKIAAKKSRGEFVMVDMNDILLSERDSWYTDRKNININQNEFVRNLWLPVNGKTADLMKVGLKNVLLVGKSGGSPITVQALLDGFVMFRPPQKSFTKLPPIVPYVYVTGWQEMLDQVYIIDWEARSSSRVTHDANTLIQALRRVNY